MTDCKRPGQQADVNIGGAVNLTIARGRRMEAMLAFIRPSPFGLKEQSAKPPILNNSCTCERPTQNVLCRACGFLCRGHVQMRCPQHNDVIHLMDIKSCPSCQSSELKEFTTPKKK